MNVELELKGLMEEAKKKFLETGEVSKDLTNKLEILKKEMGDKFSAIEDRLSKSPVQDNTNTDATVGQIFTGSTNFKNFLSSGYNTTGQVNVGSFGTKAIVNATGASQPLVAADRIAGIVPNASRVLRIRDILPVMTTTSNSVEYARENVFTNSAAPQYVSPNFEGVAKAESNITFTLGTAPIRTIAHYITASRQVLEDSGALEGYINNRLVYGLKLKEEDQLLNGDGTGGNLSGIITGATAYDTNLNVSGDTSMDKLRHGIYQVEAAEYPVDAIIVNPLDWHKIELIKDSGSTTGMYVFGNPLSGSTPNIWGVPVVVTNSIASNKFLVGSFSMGAAIFDRQNATIELSNQHDSNFTKNLVTILAEERIGLAIFRPASLVYGSF